MRERRSAENGGVKMDLKLAEIMAANQGKICW